MWKLLAAMALVLAGCGKGELTVSGGRTATSGAAAAKVQDSGWGVVQGPIRSKLSIGKEVYAPDEAVVFTIEIENVSDEAVAFNIRWDPGCIHITGSDWNEIPYRGPRYSHPSRGVKLEPGKTYKFDHKISPSDYHLAPGQYVAYFGEEEAAEGELKTVMVRTASVQFRVAEK